jgi:radical SAM superfamily enzyme YgiQ (UPF0313 family)
MGLAAHVRDVNPGVEVMILETSLDADSDTSLRAVIEGFAPTWIGVRSISLFIEEVRRVVAVARGVSNAPLLLGGPIATALGRQLFTDVEGLDYVAVGEGEPILAALVTGTELARIPNVLARVPESAATGVAVPPVDATPPLIGISPSKHSTANAAGELNLSGAAAQAPTSRKAATKGAVELDSLSIPAYQLVNLDRYAQTLSYAYNQRRQGVLVTSRGCPFSCTYCFQISDAPARLQSAERVVQEIAHLHREFAIDDFYFVDDLFNLNRKRALQVFERLLAEKLGVRLYFVNGLRVDLCDEQFIDRMIEAGTVWVTYAIESACPRIQTLIRKKIDLGAARRIINYTQRQGIVVNVNTMFGFPSETAAEAQMTLDYLGSLEHPSLLPYHFNLRGYPGCEIVDQAEQAGWKRDAFLATGFSSYGDLPAGSPTFSRREMMQHMLIYHERFGLANREHLRYSVQTLRRIGYAESEILDMYTVLMNRRIRAVDELTATGAGASPPVWA